MGKFNFKKTIILGTIIAGIIIVAGITAVSAQDIKLAGTVDVDNNQIKNLQDPTAPSDAATKNYVDTLGSVAITGTGVEMQGKGTGTLTCSDQAEKMNVDLTMSRSNTGPFTSFGSISLQFSDFTMSQSAALNAGNMDTTQYSLSGIVSADTLCNDLGVPFVLTVSGNCGVGVNIQITSSNGESGTFVGNVACI